MAKCKFCDRTSYITYKAGSLKPYLAENADKLQKIASFECRGWEILQFVPKEGWRCVGVNSDEKFDDIDLSDLDWTDYDEKADEPVGIYDLTSDIQAS